MCHLANMNAVHFMYFVYEQPWTACTFKPKLWAFSDFESEIYSGRKSLIEENVDTNVRGLQVINIQKKACCCRFSTFPTRIVLFPEKMVEADGVVLIGILF